MKFIFIDVDGVLNHELWFTNEGRFLKENPDNKFQRWFSPKSVEVLNWLTDNTSAKLVVSSSWRNGRTLDELKTLFKINGITGEIIGKTPYLFFGNEDYNYSVPRGCEIKAWLETNKDILGDKISKSKYVIFDDDTDMLYWQRESFFWIDPYCGLTYTVAKQAKQYLNK